MKAVHGLAATCGSLLIGATASEAQPGYWCQDLDDVYAEVEGSTVTVHHDAAQYNCCPDEFVHTVSDQGEVIVVEEFEILTTPCLCLCCYDLSAIVEPVSPGHHVILFRWYDYETGQWQEWPLDVTVPDVGQGGEAQLAATGNSGCYDDPTAVPESPGEGWGRIKALYR